MPLSAAPQARGEIWLKRSEEETNHKKNNLDEDKKSAINKKNNSQIKKPHLKMIPIKDKCKKSFKKTTRQNM